MVLLAVTFDNLHQILQNLYVDMTPLCSQMTGVAKGLAGLGALFYIAYRVWQSLARAEPVDVFPLLRPFALGLCIMFFPTLVLGTLNSVLSPVVTGTHNILETQTFDMNQYRAQKDKLEFEAMKRNPETAYLVDKESFDNKLDELGALDAIEACGMYMDRAMCTLFKQFGIAQSDGAQLLHGEVRIVEHTLEAVHIDVGDVAHKQDGLLYLTCIADKVLHLLQGIIVLLALLIDLYCFLKALDHRTCRRGCMHDVLRGIDDTLCKVAGVCHHPLRPRYLADKESHQTEHKKFQSHTVTN